MVQWLDLASSWVPIISLVMRRRLRMLGTRCTSLATYNPKTWRISSMAQRTVSLMLRASLEGSTHPQSS